MRKQSELRIEILNIQKEALTDKVERLLEQVRSIELKISKITEFENKVPNKELEPIALTVKKI
jgi:hypothetical protein